MSIISTLRRILNDSPGTATNIDYNFQVLEDYVNTALVATDGSNGMTGPLVVGPPTADTHAATKSYVDGLWFTGMMLEFAGDTLSAAEAEEWALCNGSLQSTTDPKFAPLFQRIQYRYGGSGGSFNLPDYRGRVGVGRSDIGADAIFATVGNKGGKRDSELLSHQHNVAAYGHSASSSTAANEGGVDHYHNLDAAGGTSGIGNHGHNIGAGTQMYWVQAGQGEGVPGPGSAGRSGGFTHEGAHSHSLNGRTSASDRSLNHGHTITTSVGDHAAKLTDPQGAGTTLTDKNMPPWLVVNRIIKL